MKREQHRNANVKTARQTFRVSFQGKSEIFLSTIDNEKNSVIFISLLLPSPLGSLFTVRTQKTIQACLCRLLARDSLFHFASMLDYLLLARLLSKWQSSVRNFPRPECATASSTLRLSRKNRTTHNGDLKIQ